MIDPHTITTIAIFEEEHARTRFSWLNDFKSFRNEIASLCNISSESLFNYFKITYKDKEGLDTDIVNTLSYTESQFHANEGKLVLHIRRKEPRQRVEASISGDMLVHLENIGDKRFKLGEFSGTRGESRRLEGFSITSNSDVRLIYMAHLEGTGDSWWANEGKFLGTRGQSRRIEGFAITSMNNNYTVTYMAHLAGYGDTLIFRDGEFCGTRGESRAVEGIQVWIHLKE